MPAWLSWLHVGVTVVLIAALLQQNAEIRALDDAVEMSLKDVELLRALVRACCAP